MAYEQIRAVMTLYEHPGFKSKHCTLVQNTPDLRVYGFSKKASSLMIHRGANFSPPLRVSFNSGVNYDLPQLLLEPGRYSDLRIYNFNDKIVSVSFTLGMVPADPDPLAPVPLVAELYADKNFKGRRFDVVHDIKDLHAWAGFGDGLTSVKVFAGPNFTPGAKLRLFRHKNFLGGEIALDPGEF